MASEITGGEATGDPDFLGATQEASGSLDAFSEDTLASTTLAEAVELERGDVVGRYVVLGRLGAGAMGVVYAAYDPELDRKIALKVLRPAANEGDGHRTRIFREAQALAKLSHPNVVAIHDVGTLGERVWLAMEYVEGRTLGAWRKEQARGWQEVIAVMVDAGRGLAAAHAAGLVHRDVKPDNLMIGRDGRVRVMDFGLAFAVGGAGADDDEAARALAASGEMAVLGVRVTLAGSILGTPTYMSPEGLRGAPADARSDVYSFAVTLWEALFDQLPVDGASFAALRANVVAGRLRPPPAGSRVPGWLRRVCERGLATDPAARSPSMDALLELLERGRSRARGRRLLAGVASVAVLSVSIVGGLELRRQARVDACAAAGAAIHEVWSEAARGRLRAGLVATGAASAEDTYGRMLPWVDQWSERWATSRAAVCRRAEVDGEWSPALHARANACFEEARAALSSLLDALADAPPQALWFGVTGAASLPSVDACSDPALLERRSAPPPGLAAEVDALGRELIAAVGLEEAGRYAEARARAEALLVRAEALGYPPLTVRVRGQLAGLAARLGEPAAAEPALAAVFVDAGALGVDDVALDAANRLVFGVGYLGARPDEGLLWARAAEMMVRRLGEESGPRGAAVKSSLANVLYARGDLERAQELFEEALAINQRALGASHPLIADSLTNLADVHYARRDYDTARGLYELSLEISAAALGPAHPNRAVTLNNLGNLHLARGDHAAARPLLERALGIFEVTLGPDHPQLANTIDNLADLDRLAGDLDRADAGYLRASALVEASLGAEHPMLAGLLVDRAEIRRRRGDTDGAAALLDRALAIREAALGADHPEVAEVRERLAELRREGAGGE